MNAKGLLLFLIPALIWGSTWYVIKFQLGPTDPLLSVSMHFALAGTIMLIYNLGKKSSFRFTVRQHFFMALQGLLLFGFNYLFVYFSEEYLTSGLVAAAFSLIVFLNVFFGAIFLRRRVEGQVVIGAIIGILGIAMIFKDEIQQFNLTDDNFLGLIFCFVGIVFASLGNITSAYNQSQNMPLLTTNMFGMLYGAIALFGVALISGVEFQFSHSLSYWGSLIYLSVLGSVVAFGTYLKLVGTEGPAKAAFVLLVVPLIALIISDFFEDFTWTIYNISGATLILLSNLLTVRRNN